MEEADQKIVDEVKAHSELMKNLEYLTSEIGPRLTGSTQMQAASDWTLKRFKDYGIDAHLETTQIPHGYMRGEDRAAITAPIQRDIQIRSFGWSKPTDGELHGSVMTLDPKADPAAFKGKLKGAIMLAGNRRSADSRGRERLRRGHRSLHGVPKRDGKGGNRSRLMDLLKDEGAASS